MPPAPFHLPSQGRLEESAVEEPGERVQHRVTLDLGQRGALDDRGLGEELDIEEVVESGDFLADIPADPAGEVLPMLCDGAPVSFRLLLRQVEMSQFAETLGKGRCLRRDGRRRRGDRRPRHLRGPRAIRWRAAVAQTAPVEADAPLGGDRLRLLAPLDPPPAILRPPLLLSDVPDLAHGKSPDGIPTT